MAKGQQRSNRETRKPKKEKVEVKGASAFGSQVKPAETTSYKGKPKG